MTRSAILLVAGLIAVVSPGCAVSASTSSQSGSSAGSSGVPAGAGSTGRPAQQTGDGSAGAGTGSPAPAAPCVAAVNDTATSLFNGRVLIRLPKGLELIEQNPFFANLAANPQSTSCGSPVRYGAVGFFQQPDASMTQVRDTLLELRGIPADTVTWSEEGTRGRNYTGAYTAAADAKTGAAPVRGWMVVREAPGDKHAYFALFETDEASWEPLKAVFQEAGRTLLVKPRALQGPESIQPAPKPEPAKPPKAAGTIKTK